MDFEPPIPDSRSHVSDIETRNVVPPWIQRAREIERQFEGKPTTLAEDGKHNFRFIDLFAGIGGMRLPFQEAGGACVFSSEWDKYAQLTYARNFGEVPQGDITKIDAKSIPDHDVLLAGFPCQAFSLAGLRQGFSDTRGTMFFEIQRILAEKRPKAFLLENVKQLKNHDKGRTLATILQVLRGQNNSGLPIEIPMSEQARQALSVRLNYQVVCGVLRATEFGVPQNRERIYIVGIDRDAYPTIDLGDFFSSLTGRMPAPTLGTILEPNKSVDPKYTISDRLLLGLQLRMARHKSLGNGFGHSVFSSESAYCNTMTSRYYKDGREILIDQSDVKRNPRKLTPRECARIQGFPESFDVGAVSDTQIYRQFGNSVTVPVIRSIANALLTRLFFAKSDVTYSLERTMFERLQRT
ncbi:MAG: modification methylase HpaII [Pseudomonadota bacterium]